MKKEELIGEIKSAFKNVKLEDGIGLWEAQGLDDYADSKTILELRKKDETEDWSAISFKDISFCASSLSFFDAKGMKFCLPKFLMLDILEPNEHDDQESYPVDVLFTLGLNGKYQIQRFSLFNNRQKECVICYLKYKLNNIEEKYEEYSVNLGWFKDDPEYINLMNILHQWEEF